MANVESCELTGGRLCVGAFVANVAEKPLANFAQEGIQLVGFAFGDQFDATIGEIANVTADFVAASDRVRRVSKPDALHSPGILYGATLSSADFHAALTCRVDRKPTSKVYPWRASAASLDQSPQLFYCPPAMNFRIQMRADVYLVVLLALTLHVGLCSGTEPSSASGKSTAELASILVLRDGGVLTGSVSRIDDGYLIKRSGTEIQVPTAKVLIACRTLAEGYEARRAEVNLASVESHLSLAAWCLTHGLKPQAARELADVRALEPDHPRLALLERRLAAAESVATSNHSANQRLPGTPIATAPPDVRESHASPLATETDLSGPVVERFTRKVQPILVNNCTTSGCHHRGGSQQFQLDRASCTDSRIGAPPCKISQPRSRLWTGSNRTLVRC